MTRVKVKRVDQRRREQLFRGEITLRRTLLHLGNSYAYAKRAKDHVEVGAVLDGIWIVQRLWFGLVEEENELCH